MEDSFLEIGLLEIPQLGRGQSVDSRFGRFKSPPLKVEWHSVELATALQI